MTDTAKRSRTSGCHRLVAPQVGTLPIKFTVWVVIAVVVASLFEIIPTFVIRSNVPTIETVHALHPLELAGRDIYVAEGCYNCHSQMIRPILSETERYGDYSKPGEFVYDHPFQWGSRRIGPDLARVGVKINPQALWHYRALPATPEDDDLDGSIMPASTPGCDERKKSTSSLHVRVNACIKACCIPGRTGSVQRQVRRRHSAMKPSKTPRPGQGILARSPQQIDGSPTPGYGPRAARTEYLTHEQAKVIAMIAYLQPPGHVDLNKRPRRSRCGRACTEAGGRTGRGIAAAANIRTRFRAASKGGRLMFKDVLRAMDFTDALAASRLFCFFGVKKSRS